MSIKLTILLIASYFILSIDCCNPFKRGGCSSRSCEISRGNGLIDTADKLREALQTATPGTVIRLAAVEIYGSFVANNLRNVVIEGTSQCDKSSKIKGSGTALTLQSVNNVVVKNLIIEGMTNAIKASSSNDLKIESNVLNEISGKGIEIDGTSQRVTIDSNVISSVGGVMISLGPGVSNGQVNENVFHGNSNWVRIDGNNFRVNGNVGDGSASDGFLVNGCGFTFRNNICSLKRSAGYCINAPKRAPNCSVSVDNSNISSGGKGLNN